MSCGIYPLKRTYAMSKIIIILQASAMKVTLLIYTHEQRVKARARGPPSTNSKLNLELIFELAIRSHRSFYYKIYMRSF